MTGEPGGDNHDVPGSSEAKADGSIFPAVNGAHEEPEATVVMSADGSVPGVPAVATPAQDAAPALDDGVEEHVEEHVEEMDLEEVEDAELVEADEIEVEEVAAPRPSPPPRRDSIPPGVLPPPPRRDSVPPIVPPRRPTVPPVGLPRRDSIPPGTLPPLPPRLSIAPGVIPPPTVPREPPPTRFSSADALRALREEGPAERRAAIEREIPKETDDARRAILEYELGLLLQAAGEEEQAATAHGRALAADATLVPNLWALRRLCERRGSWDKVAKLLDVELRGTAEPSEQAELLVEKGHVLADRLGDVPGARAAWEAALAADPASLPALMALERLALKDGDAATRESLLRRMAGATAEPARRAELLIELAHLRASAAGVDDAEIFAIFDEAWATGGAPERVLDETERFAAERGPMGDAAREAFLRVIERRIELAESRGGDDVVEQVVTLRRRQAALLRDVDAVRARAALDAALARSPGEQLVIDDLMERAEQDRRWGDLADLLGQRADRLEGTAALRVRFAQARALHQAGRDAEAMQVEAALAGEPSAGIALLVERQRRAALAGDAIALAAAWREEAGIASAAGDARWAAFAYDAAAACLLRSGDPDGAIRAHEDALAASPQDAVALDALDGLLARAGRHADRDRVLQARLATAEATARTRILEALVELRLERLGDVDGAVAAAESLCRIHGGPDGDDVVWRARLVEITRSAQRWSEAAQHLDRLAAALERGGATDRAVDARLERAELLEQKLGDAAGALAVLEQVSRSGTAGARAGEVRAEVRRLRCELGRWDDVAASIRLELAKTLEPDRIAELLRQLARVERQRNRPEEEARVWRDLAGREPDDRVAQRILREQLERGGDPLALATLLERESPGATDEEIGRRLLRAGELREDVGGDPALSAATWLRAIAGGGDAVPHAAFGLYRALARTGDVTGLDGPLGVLGTIADKDGDARAAAAIFEERASIASAVGDVASAGTLLDEALRRDPKEPGARWARLRMAATARSAHDMVDALVGAAENTEDRALAAVLFARGAAWTIATGGDGAPLVDRALREELPPESAAALATALDAVADDPRLLALKLSRPLPAEDAAGLRAERVEALIARGQLAEAAEEVARALAADAGDVVFLDAARRIAARGGDRLGEARALASLGAALPGDEGAALLADAARRLEALGEQAEAAVAWRCRLERAPGDDEAFTRAHALAAALADDGALDEILSARITVVGPDDRARLFVERGALRLRVGRPRSAADDLRAALDLAPGDRDALRRLGELHLGVGDREGGTILFDALAAQLPPDDPERREVFRRLADLHEARGDLRATAAALRKAVAAAPGDLALLDRLLDALDRDGDAEGLIEHLGARAELANGTERVRIEMRAAAVHRDRLRDPAGAREALGRALAVDPLDLEATRELVTLCESTGDTIARGGALTQASREAYRALAAVPDDPRPYRVLERVCEWQGDDDGRQLAMQAAAVMAGRPVPPRRDGLEPSRTAPPDMWERLMAPARGVALEIWTEAFEAATKLLSPDPATLGVGRSTRQNDRSPSPPWVPIDRLARSLGLSAWALHTVARADACAVIGDALVVGGNCGAPMPAVERFRVARKLVLLRERLGPLETAGDADLDLFFAACAQVAGTRWDGTTRPSPSQLEEQAKQIGKILDRRARKALQALAPRFAQLPSIASWRRAALDGATRIALAATGDLGAALAVLSLDVERPEARALARYAVSEDLIGLRRALGARI